MAKVIKKKNLLKEKVGEGGFSEESIKRAQQAIEENDVDFTPIAEKYLSAIKGALKANEDRQNHKELYGQLLDSLTQLRAQGALFHFSSITALTDIVVDLLDSLHQVDATIIEIVTAYEKSARVVLIKNIRDQNDVTCASICGELKKVCENYKERRNKSKQ